MLIIVDVLFVLIVLLFDFGLLRVLVVYLLGLLCDLPYLFVGFTCCFA